MRRFAWLCVVAGLFAGCATAADVRDRRPDAVVPGKFRNPAASARCIAAALERQVMAGQHLWLVNQTPDGGWRVTGRHNIMSGYVIADVAIEPGPATVRLPAMSPLRTAAVVEAVGTCAR